MDRFHGSTWKSPHEFRDPREVKVPAKRVHSCGFPNSCGHPHAVNEETPFSRCPADDGKPRGWPDFDRRGLPLSVVEQPWLAPVSTNPGCAKSAETPPDSVSTDYALRGF